MRVRQPGAGALIAGNSAVVLLVVMFFGWFQLNGISAEGEVGGVSTGTVEIGGKQLEQAAAEQGKSTSRSAWGAFIWIDVVLGLAVIAGGLVLGLALTGRGESVLGGVAAVATVLGALGAALILFRLISPPELLEVLEDTPTAFGVEVTTHVTRQPAAFVGLLASAGIAYGAWLTLQAHRPQLR